MKLSEFIDLMERIAPPRLVGPDDNVGLIVGDPARRVSGIMLVAECTPDTVMCARARGCNVIVAYHPPPAGPRRALDPSSAVYLAVRRDIAIYSPHTALEAAVGGASDVLADALGLEQRQPLRPHAVPDCCKLVVFVPPDAADRVAEALFAAGAGRIGNYSRCSFRSPGTGTFYGEAGARPAVGHALRLERVDELRLETVVPLDRVDAVVRALRAAHPYEQPAFDLVRLHGVPDAGRGRIGDLPRPVSCRKLIARVKQELHLKRPLLVAGPVGGTVQRCACVAGAGGDLIDEALARGAGLFLTGEAGYQQVMRAVGRGVTVVITLHLASEMPVLRRLAARIRQAMPSVRVMVHDQADPLRLM